MLKRIENNHLENNHHAHTCGNCARLQREIEIMKKELETMKSFDFSPWQYIVTEKDWWLAVNTQSWESVEFCLRGLELRLKQLNILISRQEREMQELINKEIFFKEQKEISENYLASLRLEEEYASMSVALGKKVIDEARAKEEAKLNDDPIDKEYFKRGLR